MDPPESLWTRLRGFRWPNMGVKCGVSLLTVTASFAMSKALWPIDGMEATYVVECVGAAIGVVLLVIGYVVERRQRAVVGER